jgi:hypothetical protein
MPNVTQTSEAPLGERLVGANFPERMRLAWPLIVVVFFGMAFALNSFFQGSASRTGTELPSKHCAEPPLEA